MIPLATFAKDFVKIECGNMRLMAGQAYTRFGQPSPSHSHDSHAEIYPRLQYGTENPVSRNRNEEPCLDVVVPPRPAISCYSRGLVTFIIDGGESTSLSYLGDYTCHIRQIY